MKTITLNVPTSFVMQNAAAWMLVTVGFCATLQPSRADVIGNDPNATYVANSDGNPAMALFDNSTYAIPSPSAVINSAQVYIGTTNDFAFSLLLLAPAGSDAGGNPEYTVLDQDSFTGPGTVGVETLSLNWAATSSDVLAYWGRGVSLNYTGSSSSFYSSTDSSGAFYFSAAQPTTGSTYTFYSSDVASADYSYVGGRDYAVSFNVTPIAAPEPGSLVMLGAGGLVLLGLRRFGPRKV